MSEMGDAVIVDVYEAKTNFSKLLDRVVDGEEIVIGGRASRCPPGSFPTQEAPRAPGEFAGRIQMKEDFDAAPDWLLDAFEGNE